MLRWWKSAVNFSFFLSLAAFRTRSSAWVTLARLCVRRVLCWFAFPLVSALGSTGSAADRSASSAFQLLWRSQTSHARASSATAPRLPDADRVQAQAVARETSRFPFKERLHMPGSLTTRDWTGPRDIVSVHVAFRAQSGVGIPG